MTLSLATSLALKATNVSQIGFKMLAFSAPLLAQSTGGSPDLKTSMSGALGILNLVGLVLAFGGLLFAAVMFMMGQTERMIYGLIGALIGGVSFLIVKTMFSYSGQAGVDSLNLS